MELLHHDNAPVGCINDLTAFSHSVDWLIYYCLASSGKYFMHIQDEKKLSINK